jgi:hypothetical protein
VPLYRVFSNDRRSIRVGAERVPLYSCLTEVHAISPADAEREVLKLHPNFGPPEYAPMKAIAWPPNDEASHAWLRRHVDAK